MKTKNNSFYARNSDISFSFPFFFVWFLFLEKSIVRCNVKHLWSMDLQEKEDEKDEKPTGNLIRKSLKIKDVC